MSAHDISEHVRAPASEARPSAGPLSIADPVPVGIAGFGMTTSAAGNAVGLYLLGWLIFTFYMTIAAPRTNVPVLAVFVTLTATYLLLVLAELGSHDARPARPCTRHPRVHQPRSSKNRPGLPLPAPSAPLARTRQSAGGRSCLEKPAASAIPDLPCPSPPRGRLPPLSRGLRSAVMVGGLRECRQRERRCAGGS